jgi:hypothetical protein
MINLIIEKTLSFVNDNNFFSEKDAIISLTFIVFFDDIL